jgi:hypothetical protein
MHGLPVGLSPAGFEFLHYRWESLMCCPICRRHSWKRHKRGCSQPDRTWREPTYEFGVYLDLATGQRCSVFTRVVPPEEANSR